MTEFDLIVFGGGTGNRVASAAAEAGLETALVEKGPIGGLCLNRGCNPSKMLIQHATVANRVREASEFGIDASVDEVRFSEFVREVNDELAAVADRKAQNKRDQANLTLFREEARFVDDETIELVESGETHTGEKVVVAAGSTPVVPDPIDGLGEVDFLTSADALRLETPPERLVVLGGGYIAAELGYYFDAFGTDVALVDRNETLLHREDSDVAAAFTEVAEERHDVYTGHSATAVDESSGEFSVTAETEGGEAVEVRGDELLVALGRRPNTDGVGLDATSIETDDRGFVATDERLRTSVEGVWAMGDVAGNAMFKHSGDYEGEIVVDNVVHDAGREADFTALPHAVFTEPQVAAVGRTETELDESGDGYVVGRAEFTDTAMSRALKLDRGFVKVLCDPESRAVVGCHVFGHEASVLVHEVVPAVRYGLTVDDLANTLLHAHPALSKVVQMACADAGDAADRATE
jgi:mycothione reductase